MFLFALKIEKFFYKEGLVSGVGGGVTVSMVAFQAAVPGSTPGRRMFFCFFLMVTFCVVDIIISEENKVFMIEVKTDEHF